MKVEMMEVKNELNNHGTEVPNIEKGKVSVEEHEANVRSDNPVERKVNGTINGVHEAEETANENSISLKRRSEGPLDSNESHPMKKTKTEEKDEIDPTQPSLKTEEIVVDKKYIRVDLGPEPGPGGMEDLYTRIADFLDAPELINLSFCSKKTFLACRRSQLWRFVAFRCAESLSSHLGAVTVLRRLKSWVFSGSGDGKIKLWDLESWHPMRTLQMNNTQPPQAAIARLDGSRYGGETVHSVTAIEVLGELLYTGLDDGHVMLNYLVRKQPGAPSQSRKQMGHQGKVKCLKITPERLFSGGSDGKISVYEARTLRPLQQLRGHRKGLVGLEVSGQRLFSGGEDGNIFVWKLESLTCESILSEDSPGGIRADARLNISHNEKLSTMCCYENKLFSCAWDCSIKMWNTNTLTCLASIFLNPLSICWTLAVRDVEGLPPHLVCSVRDGEIEMRSAEDLYLMPGTGSSSWSSTAEGHRSWINTVLPLPDGRIITGSDDWTIKVWHETGSEYEKNYANVMRKRKKAEIESLKSLSSRLKANTSQTEEKKEIKQEPEEKQVKVEETRTGI